MKVKILLLIVLFVLSSGILTGCGSTTGVFARTEERVANLGESITNIALDGDGVN